MLITSTGDAGRIGARLGDGRKSGVGARRGGDNGGSSGVIDCIAALEDSLSITVLSGGTPNEFGSGARFDELP